MANKVQVILKAQSYTSKDGVEGQPYHPIDLDQEEAADLIKSGLACCSENGQEIAKVETNPDGSITTSYEILNPPKTVQDVINMHVEHPEELNLEGKKNEQGEKLRFGVQQEGEELEEDEAPANAKPDAFDSTEVDNMVKSVVGYVPHVAHEVQVVSLEELKQRNGDVPKPQEMPKPNEDPSEGMPQPHLPSAQEVDPNNNNTQDLKKLEAGNSAEASEVNSAERKHQLDKEADAKAEEEEDK